MAHNYVVTAHKPTAVNACVTGIWIMENLTYEIRWLFLARTGLSWIRKTCFVITMHIIVYLFFKSEKEAVKHTVLFESHIVYIFTRQQWLCQNVWLSITVQEGQLVAIWFFFKDGVFSPCFSMLIDGITVNH